MHAQNIKNDSFRGGRNTIKLITYKNKIVISQQLQRYVVKWYPTYVLHPVWDRMEAMIRQHVYWPDIGKDVQKEVIECDVCQRTKQSTKKYVKNPAKLAEEILWNKLCVDLIGHYKICRNRRCLAGGDEELGSGEEGLE